MDFTALYESHRDRIYQLALRLLRDPDMASDATQESFRKAFEARGAFRREARPSSWLFRIAYNTCVDVLRTQRGAPRPFEETESGTSEPQGGDLESSVESREACRRVRAALETLEEDDRRLLCLQMDEGMGYAELASVLGCSATAVRMRVSRARRRLKEILYPEKEVRS